MELFTYDNNNIEFKRTNILFKYKLIILLLVLSIFLLSFIVLEIKNKTEILEVKISQKDDIIASKINTIVNINEPIRDENYVGDLYKNIGFKLTKNQYKRFSYLALKYRSDIEKAKVPATLVWWTAFNETGFDPDAKNPKSTAKGMFQFLDGTWKIVCKIKGYSEEGRFNEDKQVRVMLDYLNYLYYKHKSWGRSMTEYHGGEYHYPMKFLFK